MDEWRRKFFVWAKGSEYSWREGRGVVNGGCRRESRLKKDGVRGAGCRLNSKEKTAALTVDTTKWLWGESAKIIR